MQLELTLARSAAERRDTTAWRAALRRAGRLHARLWRDGAAVEKQRAALEQLRAMPLRLALPGFGSTLRQLQAQRQAP